MEHTDFYKILQVDPSAEPEVIAAAYKRLAQKYHPDINRSPVAMLRMQDINTAYEVLSNADTRAQYDRDRAFQSSDFDRQLSMRVWNAGVDADAPRRTTTQQQRQVQATWLHRRVGKVAGLLLVGIIFVTITATAVLRPPSTNSNVRFIGIWEGELRDRAGSVYSSKLRIRVSATNNATGSIILALKAAPPSTDQQKIGMKATAYVKGTFDPERRVITIGTYQRDDPYDIIDINEYQLSLSADGATLSGQAGNNGTWTGTISAVRKD